MDLQKMQQIQKSLDDGIIKEKNIKLSQNESEYCRKNKINHDR